MIDFILVNCLWNATLSII